ncbi:MAG: hypothetical protein IJ468_14865 [Lachnospiraceae bacterium]|nr:hypothetical protein [Lachnospiraceae bacterium]
MLMKIPSSIKYYAERIMPYALALGVTVVLWKCKINYIDNCNFNDAIDGINTVAALIIGFLGAILPVILGMKNESKFVQYVFEKDTNRLLLKYIKSTIVTGLTLVGVSITLYFRNDFTKEIESKAFYAWVFIAILFFLCTYRSLSNMLELVFTTDNSLDTGRQGNSNPKSDKEEELENRLDDSK